MPNLNPFGKKNGPPTSSGGGWKMPSLWPQMSPTSAPKQTTSPSAWQRMQTGTRNFWSKTADAINPFDDANDNLQQPDPTGRNSAFRQATMSKGANQKSKSFLPSWSGQDKADNKPKTVQDFLAQPRPGF
jgi:hypothetical protein